MMLLHCIIYGGLIYLAFEFGYLLGHNTGVDRMGAKIRKRIDSGQLICSDKYALNGNELKMRFWRKR